MISKGHFLSPLGLGVVIACLYPWFMPLQGLWHKIIDEHLNVALPTPGTLFFRTPLLITLFLLFSIRFKGMHWLIRPLASPSFALLGIGALIFYRTLPFPHHAHSFAEYQHYAYAVYATLAFTVWAFLSSLVKSPLGFIAKNYGKIFSSIFITLGLGFYARELFNHSPPWFLGFLMDQYRSLLFYGTEFLLSPFFQNTSLDIQNNQISAEDFRVTMAYECSGFQGIQLISIISGCYLLFEKPSLKKVFHWFLLGLALSLIFNQIRVALLIGIGAMGHTQWAINAFHSSAGNLFFCLIGTLMIYLAHRSGHQIKNLEVNSRPWDSSLEMTDLMPFIVFLFLTLLFRPLTPGFDWSYPLKTICLTIVLLRFTNWKTFTTPSLPKLWSIFWGVLIAIFWIQLQPVDPKRYAPDGIWGLLWVITKVIGSIVLIPIIEERFFRRYLLHILSFRKARPNTLTPFELVPCLFSSILFGIVHQNLWGGILAGIIFCCVAAWRHKLSDAIWCHAGANATIALAVLFFHQTHLW